MDHLTPQQIAGWIADTTRAAPILLDVREPWEHETAHIAGTTLVPMSMLTARLAEVEALQDRTDGILPAIVCICHHGARSMQVAAFLEQHGMTNIINMTGGIHGWSTHVDPAVPTY